MYVLVSDTSIGYLFLGGILPGRFKGEVPMALDHAIAARREIWLFIFVLVAAPPVMIVLPEIVLWLPHLLEYAG